MVLHSLVVFLLLVGHLCCISQANASTLRGVRFGQQGDLFRVVFELQEDVSYRLEAGSAPTLTRIIFPTLKFPPKLQTPGSACSYWAHSRGTVEYKRPPGHG